MIVMSLKIKPLKLNNHKMTTPSSHQVYLKVLAKRMCFMESNWPIKHKNCYTSNLCHILQVML